MIFIVSFGVHAVESQLGDVPDSYYLTATSSNAEDISFSLMNYRANERQTVFFQLPHSSSNFYLLPELADTYQTAIQSQVVSSIPVEYQMSTLLLLIYYTNQINISLPTSLQPSVTRLSDNQSLLQLNIGSRNTVAIDIQTTVQQRRQRLIRFAHERKPEYDVTSSVSYYLYNRMIWIKHYDVNLEETVVIQGPCKPHTDKHDSHKDDSDEDDDRGCFGFLLACCQQRHERNKVQEPSETTYLLSGSSPLVNQAKTYDNPRIGEQVLPNITTPPPFIILFLSYAGFGL